MQTVTVPQLITIRPPDFLMEPTPVPSCNATNNAELLECFFDMRDALKKANADKEAIKKAVQE